MDAVDISGKRGRQTNFTFDEEVKLVEIALNHAGIIECCKQSQVTTRMKNDAWALVMADFNMEASTVDFNLFLFSSIHH